VALSADGNIAIVGGFAEDGGVALVFTRTGGQWGAGQEIDAADSIAVGQHVEIIFVPVAGGPACRCALEDEGVLLHRQSVWVHH
jgi:hypothetical protein